MSALGRRIAAMTACLERDDYPRHGICSHFGVTVAYPRLSINVSHRNGLTQVTLYSARSVSAQKGRAYHALEGQGYFIGFPAHIHRMRVASVAAALDCAVVETWNGEEGHSGVSAVFDRPCPKSLVTAISNYRSMPSPFRLREEDRQGFQAFHAWLDAGKTEIETACPAQREIPPDFPSPEI